MLPLKDLKVLDLSHAGDGPMCALMLAEAGADVIKLEPLKGEPFRQGGAVALFNNANRNKRSLALDLQSAEGRQIALKLAAAADILVESFTPGIADKLGIGYTAVNSLNPRIIYCSLSGFGQTGPYSARPAYDPVIQAMSGFMATSGEPGRPPVRVAPSVIGFGTAFLAAYKIMLAIIAREKTGKGQRIDAAFFDTAVFYMIPFITGYSATGFVMPKMGSANPVFVPYQCFETADRYIFIGVTNDRFWQGLCSSLGLDDLGKNQKYGTLEKRLEHRDELVSQLSEILKIRSSKQVLDSLEAVGVPCAPVQEVPEIVDDPQVNARQILFDMEYPEDGKMKLAYVPVKASDMETVPAVRAPRLGEHTREILLGLGYTQAEISSLEHKGIIKIDKN